MAHIVASTGCCHCKACWNLANVPHGTLGVVFTVREYNDEGFELHVLPEGFLTKAAATAAFERSRGKSAQEEKAVSTPTHGAWRKIAAHILNERVDKVVAAELAKINNAQQKALS